MNENIVEAGDIADTIEHQETKLSWFEIDVSDCSGDKSVGLIGRQACRLECAFPMIQLELDLGDHL